MSATRLGLIGDNIAASQAPLLHRLAGELCDLRVSYEPLVPAELEKDFDAVFESCRREGYRGLNITLPYKESVLAKLADADPATRSIGACNTVVFEAFGPRGFNTDRTGFVAAFRKTFGKATPGIVAMAGAGGVGKAIAFALCDLGVDEIRFFDPDHAKAQGLARSIRAGFPELDVSVAPTIEGASAGADGLVNSTPLGMVGYGGTAFPRAVFRNQRWAFDAVYTPVKTQFLDDARTGGLSVMSGYELFFHQGIDAFRIFTGCDVDPIRLRNALQRSEVGRRKIA